MCRMLYVFCLKQAVKRLYKFPFVEERSPYPLEFDSDTIKVICPLEVCGWNMTIDPQEVGIHGCC